MNYVITRCLSSAHWIVQSHVVWFFWFAFQLTRKNLTVKNLKRLRKNLERDAGRSEAAKCDFFPRTFSLPSEYHIFVEEFKRTPGSTWIMKPVSFSLWQFDAVAICIPSRDKREHFYAWRRQQNPKERAFFSSGNWKTSWTGRRYCD